MAACTLPPDSIDNGYVLQNSAGLVANIGQEGKWINTVVVDYKCFPHYALADGYQMKCNAGTWEAISGYGTPRCKYSLATEGNRPFSHCFAHACIGHVTRYFSIIGETLHRWGKRILSH